MSENRKLADNVISFLAKASELCGRIEEERFSQDMFCQLVEGDINSPIEDLFYIAFNAMSVSLFEKVNPEPFWNNRVKDWMLGVGVFIKPQAQIGKYKVDFLITRNLGLDFTPFPPLIVELDGHDFHDKDKKQRAYEKARDRFFVKEGYKVLHFTGSEVFKDPFAISYEVLDLIGCVQEMGITEYEPKNPLGIE
jgi:very-short-patch-repair endonuclease